MRARLISLALGLAPSLFAESPVAPVVEAVRTNRPPRLEDFRSMAPNGELSGEIARLGGFVQREPSDGQPATQQTEVYMSYDGENLYVVFVCFDNAPEAVRARMLARGTQVLEDDHVSIQLDTFRDRRRAYAFAANPFGVQSTAVWVEGEGWDYSFDTVWHADGELTGRGYVVWMSIPFRSLRFPPRADQSWGVMLQRSIPRNNEDAYWPSYSSRIEGRLNQAGLLTGIEDVSPGRNAQVIPYGVFRSYRTPRASDTFEPRLGLDAKLVLRDSLVLDATVQPDYSQIESDEPQVTVNQRFEVFFPEKRPFFLENASYFQTPIDLLFTRRIRDPKLGVRLTGKIGPNAFGALVADDHAEGDPARFGVVRYSRDVGAQSSLGFMLTHRDSQTRRNDVGGVDGRIKLGANWTAAFQAVASATELADGGTVTGPAYQAQLSRAGRRFNYDVEYKDRSPGFRTDVGFDPRPDIRSVFQLASYRFRPEGKRLVSWGPDFVIESLWDHDGNQLDFAIGPAFHWELRRQTNFGVYYLDSKESLLPKDHDSIRAPTRFSTSRWGLLFGTSFVPQISVNGHFYSGSGINLHPVAGSAPSSHRFTSADLGVVLRPVTSLTIDNRYLRTRLSDVFDNHIFRSRWSYQWSRSLSARVILQYDALDADPEATKPETRGRFNADFLVTYFLHHGTALYVGYNTNLQELDPRLWSAGAGRFSNDSEQFFVKFSYLVRF